MTADTIAAVATPPGRGGVGIVRVSGPAAPAIAEALAGELPPPRHARYGPIRDRAGRLLDQGLTLFFPAPHSYTGEDVVEFQVHGGPVLLDLVLAEALALGARLAEPGEFTRRAFLNDKLDLAQAEAVADLIEASTESAARAAVASLSGAFSQAVNALHEAMVELRCYVEGAIDFADEEIDFLSESAVGARLDELEARLGDLRRRARQGTLLQEGLKVVILGRPNAGKSSLLNRLAGRETAIVTHIPGTTRDLVRERIEVQGMPVHVLDTAGLRESDDPVEQEGIRRAWAALSEADHCLLVVDDAAGPGDDEARVAERLPAGVGLTVVANKIDRSGRPPGPFQSPLGPGVRLSARTGAGVDALREHLARIAGLEPVAGEGVFLARRRHLQALETAQAALIRAREQWRHGAGELLAEELRAAHTALAAITGEFDHEDLLDQIFSRFCIGK